MVRVIRIIFIAINFLFVLPSFASPTSNELKDLLNAVKTMQASFTQVIYDNRNKAVDTSYGSMSMERPGKFRWEVKKPIPQLIIANQNKLWIYDPDLEQVTIRKLDKATNDSPALLLSQVDTELDKNYNVTSSANQGVAWFALVPRKADNMFEKIKLGFVNKQIKEMELTDHLGHITRVKFTDLQINKGISASLFNFKPAKNIDVIDETKR